nr:class I SAM-dependent methyltransferase [uncultured Flavobacterium sp.]
MKTEFWEQAFIDKKEMWGQEPAKSSELTAEFFANNNVKRILIPGIGYGRNAKPFTDKGISVTGIEISKTAIELARKYFPNDVKIHEGSVTGMPYDNNLYDGIFCYALIHLLNRNERIKLIKDCYSQLEKGGFMVFTTITKKAETYGKGTFVDKDRFEMFGGVKMFFYDRESIDDEFDGSGLFEITEVEENYPFYMIKCKKA